MQVLEYQKLYQESVSSPEKFWGEAAEEISWFKKWDQVFEWNYPDFGWFVGGRLNITYNCLDRHIQAGRGEKPALVYLNENYERQEISYAELLEKVCQLANGLKSLGIKKGDRVVLYMPHSIEQVIAMLASVRIGAVHSVVFAGFSEKALRDRVKDLQAIVIITADWTLRRGKKINLLATVQTAAQGLRFVEKTVVFNRDRQTQGESLREPRMPLVGTTEIDFYQLMEKQSSVCEPENLDAEDPLFVLYTSGSTGKPKGVIHTVGGYLVYAHYTTKKVFDIRGEEIYWCTADLGWITGHSYVVYGPLSNGLTSLIVEGAPDYPSSDHWYKILESEKVNVFYTSPTAIRMLRKYGGAACKKYDFSHLKVLGTVGEPINPEVWQWYNENIGRGKCPIADTWWQTETGGHMIVTLPGLPQKPGVAGLPFFGIEAVVVDKRGRELPANQKGFLVVKKPWPGAMRGCLNNREKFEEYWQQIHGVYTTGDYAVKDTEGYIQILGRSDDVINVSGHRVGSAEVENELVKYPGVTEAAIIGKPDAVKGEHLKAFVVLKPGVEPDDNSAEEIKKYIRTEIAAFAVPDEIEFVSSLPKTRSGKIMRRVLRAKELGQSEGDLSTLED